MRMWNLQLGAIFTLLVGIVAMVGCDTAETTGTEDVTGQLTVKLTDAPGDIVEAEVTITRVAVVPTDDSASGEAGEGGIEVLSEEPVTVDLVQLQDGVTEVLGEVDLPAGSYSQIRLVTERTASVSYETAAGDSLDAELMLPSAEETGVKINFDAFTIDESGDEIEVTLDFDVAKSFVKAGQSGMYIFKPVVQAESVTVIGENPPENGS